MFLQYFSKTYAFALKNALNISIDHSSLLTRRTKKMNKIRFIALEKPFIFFFYNISLRRILSPPDSLIWKLNIILINHEMSARAGPAGPRRAPAHVPPPHPPCVLRLPPPPRARERPLLIPAGLRLPAFIVKITARLLQGDSRKLNNSRVAIWSCKRPFWTKVVILKSPWFFGYLVVI